MKALLNNKNITVIGEPTSGTVHGVKRFILDEKYMLQVTTIKYYDENSNLLQNKGIIPDVYIEDTLDSIMSETDPQFEYALNLAK